MYEKISKTKLALAILSLVITFFVWQQGLRDSLERPSVSFDLAQKEYEITYLAKPAIPDNLRDIFFPNEPDNSIQKFLFDNDFDQLTDRNKLIRILITADNEYFEKNSKLAFNQPLYELAFENLEKKFLNNSYVPSEEFFEDFINDKYLYHLLSEEFNFDDSKLINNSFAQNMFFKLIAIKLLPLITIIIGTLLVIKSTFGIIISKTINWKPFKALELNSLDMVLLISGGFVVLGEVISPIFSITIVEILTKNLSEELSQSLKIFFGYFFMALPPMAIIYFQIKSTGKKFSFKKDYFQFNSKPLRNSFNLGFKGFLMIIPFVLLTSLLMRLFVENQNGSNPLLEIVLNNNNYIAFTILFITTTILAPFFEEIIFRGVLLPILSRDFGILFGIFMSSFVFALAHLSVGEFPPLLVLGIGLACTRLISGRLASSIIMHSLWNGLTFFNLFLLRT